MGVPRPAGGRAFNSAPALEPVLRVAATATLRAIRACARPAHPGGQPFQPARRIHHPYPGSTTLTAVNAAVTGMVRTLSIELAPVRVNAIHPGPIGDSPFWQGKAELADTLAKFRSQTLTGELGDMAGVVDACRFLLDNRLANGIDLPLDGGHP